MRETNEGDGGVRLELDFIFKELELLQMEMDKRLERHSNAFNIFVALLGAVIVGFATVGSKVPLDHELLALIYLPWLTTPLSAMFFDDELWRATTDLYIHRILLQRIRELLARAGSLDTPAFRQTLTARIGFAVRVIQDQKWDEPARKNPSGKDEEQKRNGPLSAGQDDAGSLFDQAQPRAAANTRRYLFWIPFAAALASTIGLALRIYCDFSLRFPTYCQCQNYLTDNRKIAEFWPVYVFLGLAGFVVDLLAYRRFRAFWKNSELVWDSMLEEAKREMEIR